MKRKITFLGIPVDAMTMKETVKSIDKTIQSGKSITHGVINAGKIVLMRKDKELFDSVTRCDIINADGQSIVWASGFLGSKLPERVAGIDLMNELLKLAVKRKYKCYFFGAREDIVVKVVEIVARKYGKEIIAGYRNGYYSEKEEPEVAKKISDSGANLLFVGISSPKKEKFLYKYRDVLQNINFTMGVGGSFDVIAGVTRRAPVWLQNIGLEWFYRFLQEPARMWRRYLLGNLFFYCLVIKEKLKNYKI